MSYTMLITIVLFSMVAIYNRTHILKFVLLLVITLTGIFGIYVRLHPIPLITLYAFLVIAPVLLILLKKNLLIGLLLWFLFSLFSGYIVIPLPLIPDISPERLIWLSLISILLIEIVIEGRKPVPGFRMLEFVMIVFSIYILFSMIATGSIYKEGEGFMLKSFINGYAIPYTIYFISKNIMNNEEKIRKIFISFTFIGFYLGITAVFEHFRLDYLIFPKAIIDPGAGIHFGRARGPFLSAGPNGTVMGMLFFIAIYTLSQSKSIWMKLFCIITVGLIPVGILFTYTRAPWIAFTLSSFLIPVFFPQYRKIFVVCVLALILLIYTQFSLDQLDPDAKSDLYMSRKKTAVEAISERSVSVAPVHHRKNLYTIMAKMFLDKPLLGFGFDQFSKVNVKYYKELDDPTIMAKSGEGKDERGNAAQDQYISVLVELGILGLGFFLFILIYPLRASMKLYHKLPHDVFMGRGLVIVFWGIFINLAVNLFFRETKLFLFPNCIFFFVISILAVLDQKLKYEGMDGSKKYKTPLESEAL